METSIIENVLSDGSKVYDVVLSFEGPYKLVLAAASLEAAHALQDALYNNALDACVEVR